MPKVETFNELCGDIDPNLPDIEEISDVGNYSIVVEDYEGRKYEIRRVSLDHNDKVITLICE